MEFFEVLKARRSVRIYADKPVESEKLDQILKAVNRAPSAGNLQAFEVYVVTRDEQRKELAVAAMGQNFMSQAPLALVFCADADRSTRKYGQRGASLYCVQDATIACTYAMLTVTALGLSSVWVGAFDEERVRDVIKESQGYRPVAMLSIGYATDEPRVRLRRNLDDLVHRL